jgi:hypothetical protein
MKRLIPILLFLLPLFLFSSCIIKSDDLGKFEVDININNLILKIDSGASAKSGLDVALDTGLITNADSLISLAGGDPNVIKKVEVRSIVIKVVKPGGRNFDPINAIILKVSNTVNPSSKIDFIPEGTLLPRGKAEINVPVTTKDVQGLLKNPNLRIECSTEIIEGVVITEDMIISMDIKCVAIVDYL